MLDSPRNHFVIYILSFGNSRTLDFRGCTVGRHDIILILPGFTVVSYISKFLMCTSHSQLHVALLQGISI